MKKNTLLIKVALTLVFLSTSLLAVAQITQRGTFTSATSGGTSITITKPTGIAVDDIMIANISEGDNSALSGSVSSAGWTVIDSRTLGATNMKGTVLYKIAVLADVTALNYTFILSTGTDSCSGAIIAFTGVNPTTPFDVTPGTILLTNTSFLTASSITTVSANAAIIMLGQVSNDRSYSLWSTTSPGALTELYDVITTTGQDSSVGAAWAIKTTPGVTGIGAATLSGSNRSGGILLALKPVSPPTITSLGSASGCVGSSITINGTNLTGATASGVTIGGTAVSSITSNSGTVLVAVVGSGTTGTVSVATPGGTATSAATFTVNPTPAQPSVITGVTAPCVGTSQTYSVTNVLGVTYNWTFPAGWSQTAGGTTNSITVTVGANSGNVSVTPSNPCVGTARTLAVTATTSPAQPSAITGNATPCSSTSQIYSVTNVPGTTYFWTFPAGWSQTAGGTTNSITVTTSGTSGAITVTPSNSCGNGTAQTLATTVSSIPAQPSTITGNTSLCSGTSQTYSVTNVSGTTYTWAFPVGWTQTAGGTTNSITVTVGANSGNVQVTPSNSCGNGTARTLSTTVTAAPTITGTTPGSRTGAGTVDLSATASSGTISWFANVIGGSALGTGTNFTTPGIIITTTYYVETTNGSCTSTPRVAVVATVNFPEVTVLGNGNIIMDEDITPIPTDFTNLGTTGVGVGLTRTYTINNSGTVALTIGTINIGGLNASEFVVTTAPASSVAAGLSTTFSIRFTPTVLGTRNANVSFAGSCKCMSTTSEDFFTKLLTRVGIFLIGSAPS